MVETLDFATVDSGHTASGFDTSELRDWILPEPEVQSVLGSTQSLTTLDNATQISEGQAVSTAPATPAKIFEPIKRSPLRFNRRGNRLKLLQQWECIVTDVHEGSVECQMYDLTDASNPMEVAEVHIDEFDTFDRPLLAEGIVFYWSVGHETNPVGNVRRYSELRVRRMPSLSKSRRKEIEVRAKNLSKLLNDKK